MNTVLTNLMNLRNNPHAAFSIYGAALIEILKLWLPHYESQLAGTQKILTWYGILAATTTGGNTPTPPSPAPVTAPGPVTPKAGALSVVALICFCGVIFTPGCTAVKIYDPTTGQPAVSAVSPAWPWQDSFRSLKGLTVTAKTNNFAARVSGLDESQVTSTNAVDLVSKVTGAAVSAAVQAAK
ncbi:MAG: hypothetical protein U1F65_05720 [Verrucomicrobiota bacterium]